MRRLPPLLEEFIVASALMGAIAVVVALGFWWLSGISPWPYVILMEVAGFGWGTVMLTLSSPRRQR